MIVATDKMEVGFQGAIVVRGPRTLDALHHSLKERRYNSQHTPKGFLIETEGVETRKLQGRNK
jgi:hypothetical protein